MRERFVVSAAAGAAAALLIACSQPDTVAAEAELRSLATRHTRIETRLDAIAARKAAIAALEARRRAAVRVVAPVEVVDCSQLRDVTILETRNAIEVVRTTTPSYEIVRTTVRLRSDKPQVVAYTVAHLDQRGVVICQDKDKSATLTAGESEVTAQCQIVANTLPPIETTEVTFRENPWQR